MWLCFTADFRMKRLIFVKKHFLNLLFSTHLWVWGDSQICPISVEGWVSCIIVWWTVSSFQLVLWILTRFSNPKKYSYPLKLRLKIAIFEVTWFFDNNINFANQQSSVGTSKTFCSISKASNFISRLNWICFTKMKSLTFFISVDC